MRGSSFNQDVDDHAEWAEAQGQIFAIPEKTNRQWLYKNFWCRFLGHQWIEGQDYEYTCRRCGEYVDANL